MQTLLVSSEVIARYCPEIRFHSREKYLPCSPKQYLDNSDLYDDTSKLINHIDLLKTNTTGFTSKLKHKQLLYGNDNLTEVPLIVKSKQIMNSNDISKGYEINYMLYFPYNAGGVFNIGSHEGDWEHITVRLDNRFKLQGVYYGNHRSHEGVWVPYSKVPLNANGRIIAYCAKGSHGFWPSPGYHLRIFGFGNDYTNDKGIHWVPSVVDRIINVDPEGIVQRIFPENIDQTNIDLLDPCDESPDVVRDLDSWQLYLGDWGEIHSYRNNAWFTSSENIHSINAIQRFFNIKPKPKSKSIKPKSFQRPKPV